MICRAGFIVLLLILALSEKGISQTYKATSTSDIKNLIQTDSIEKARSKIEESIQYYRQEKNYDSLAGYVELVSHPKLNDNYQSKALEKAETLAKEIQKLGGPYAVKKALQEVAWIYSNISQPQKAYELLKQAREHALKISNPLQADLSSVEYSLGHNASVMGNFQIAKEHYIKSISLLEQYDPDNHTDFQVTYNALGGIMWYESKLDSTAYYFEKSLAYLKKSNQSDLMNRYFRPALVKMNLSILMNALGKNQEALNYCQESIKLFEKYIKQSNDESRRFQALKHRLVAIENLGSFYNTIGENKRALELINYAHLKKKEIFEEGNINNIISLILLCEAKLANLDYQGAAKDIDKAIELLEANDETYDYWYGAALINKASVCEKLGKTDDAGVFYEKGEKVFRLAMVGKYSKDYLDQLMEISLFYAKNDQPEKAESLAREVYNFGKGSDFKNTLQDLYHTLNLAEVYFLSENYDDALYYSSEAIHFNTGNIKNTKDSVLFHYRKPKALLINAQSQYHILPHNRELLEKLSLQVEEALGILEQRKQIVVTHEDVSLLIAENMQLFDFGKKLQLKLYELNPQEFHLDTALTLHESSVYSRIRSRLNLRENHLKGQVPDSITQRENELRQKVSETLKSEAEDLETFFKTNRQWQLFLDSLQNNYPKYYKMKYASLEASVSGVQQFLPKNSTLIRYFFVEDALYAAVMNKHTKQLVHLEYKSVKNHIEKLLQHEFDYRKTSPLLVDLHKVLWEPLAPFINTPKIVIIPDKELFNLSFELLTPLPITSFKDLSKHSLLSQYAISYNYSLLNTYPNSEIIAYHSDYIAFAPVFTQAMKEDYLLAVKDSVDLDISYLTLLPQPFSENVIKEFSKIFSGDYFLNENASKDLFTHTAGEHKIIHISTHAESDNISPELSRLIFAKNLSKTDRYGENSLYTYEIYNINLTSELAILTACETGKPTHHPGEGMISLAHAFNYAGSKSILTSLWKIDEVSSTNIVSLFYENLKKGMDKDVALQQAKLTYLSTAEGRTAAPEYWAGLILMGDTNPIRFSVHPYFYYITGIILFFALLIFWLKRKKSS